MALYTINTGAGGGGFGYGNVTIPAGGYTTGTTYTLAGTGAGLNYASMNSVLSVSTGTSFDSGWDSTKNTLKVTGDTEITGNLKVKGRDLCQILDAIESRLGVLNPNPELEKEFDELKELGDAYREAEKKFLEQKRVFEILKKQDE